MKNILDQKNIGYLILSLVACGYQLPSFALDFIHNTNFITQLSQFETEKLTEKEGWSEWRSWRNFPHHQIQLGVSFCYYSTNSKLS